MGPHRRQRQQAGGGDAVQDAEIDPRLGEQQVAAHRHRDGGRDDQRQPVEEGAPADAVPVGEHQADAHQHDEAAGDQVGEPAPAGAGFHRPVDEGVEAQIPGEMVDDHRGDRDAAQDVDEVDAGGRAGGRHGTHRALIRRRAGRRPDATAPRRTEERAGAPSDARDVGLETTRDGDVEPRRRYLTGRPPGRGALLQGRKRMYRRPVAKNDCLSQGRRIHASRAPRSVRPASPKTTA